MYVEITASQVVAATCQFVGVQMKRASESIMSFPPPLRTMEGEKSLQRRQHYFTCMKGTEVVVDDTATAKTSRLIFALALLQENPFRQTKCHGGNGYDLMRLAVDGHRMLPRVPFGHKVEVPQ